MKRNKKGFTIVELVIVIAVIAILAAVLIPTFAGLIKKANISADTQMVRNLNTALVMAEAGGEEIDEFSEVLSAARDAGYIISNLNPTAENCYFVWESSTNQFLLVDGEKNYEVIFASEEGYPAIGETWYFATSDREVAEMLKADAANYNNFNVKDMVANAKDFTEALAAGGEQILYIDESVALDKDNILTVTDPNANVVIDMGSATLNTNGVLPDVIPVSLSAGTTTIKNGVISAIGSAVDQEGDPITIIVNVEDGAVLNLEGTTISAADGGGKVLYGGNGSLKGVTIDTKAVGLDLSVSAKVTIEDTTIICTGTGANQGSCVWACSYKWDAANNQWIHGGGDSKATIVSGTYSGGKGGYAAIVSCTGDVEIQGGTFTAPAGKMFDVRSADKGEIVLKGGTFNGKTLGQLGVDGLKALCVGTCNVTVSGGVYTISK